jgi:site-specific DNA-methyltransferase (adenine-specific)
MLRKNTQDAMRGVYSFVPIQDFSQHWTDQMLYEKYGLADDEIAFIETMVRPVLDDA